MGSGGREEDKGLGAQTHRFLWLGPASCVSSELVRTLVSGCSL